MEVRSLVIPETIERSVCDVDVAGTGFGFAAGFAMLAAEVDFGSCDGFSWLEGFVVFKAEVVLGFETPDRVTAVFFCRRAAWEELGKTFEGLGFSSFLAVVVVVRGFLAAVSEDLDWSSLAPLAEL